MVVLLCPRHDFTSATSSHRKHTFRIIKIVDYMMAGIPVICAIDAGNDPVAEAQCGFSVRPNDHQALASVIIDLMRLGNDSRLELGERGKQYVLRNYSYEVLANRFLEALK